jgi:hypothetical protein
MKPHLLLHDNAQPHTAKKTQYHVNDLNFDLLEHSPYSTDLAPRDCHLSFAEEAYLRLRIFESRDNLEGEVRRVLMHEIPLRAYVDAIDSLFTRWTQCCRLGGGFVEKVSVGCDGDAE